MAFGPLGPTVYSVMRTFIVVIGWVLPSGMTRWAAVPCGKRRVAWRVPLLSVSTLPRADCIPRDAQVDAGYNGIRLKQNNIREPFIVLQRSLTCRWAGRYPVFR